MKRPERRMTDEDAIALLKKQTYGVLSVVGENGTPYGVPLNYFYMENENAIFFHCASSGRKTDAIGNESRVSFTVVGREEIDPLRFTTLYESVITEGRASIIEANDEKRLRLRQLCDVLTPGAARRDEVIEAYLPRTTIVRIDIEHISGKANRGDGE